MKLTTTALGSVALALTMTGTILGQGAPAPQAPPRPAAERLGPNLFRIGNVRVDTSRREVTVAGTTNDVKMLEWVANTKGGNKAYESAITLETDAVSFNAALLLIGLDKSRARVPEAHFDAKAPEGDRVEILVEFDRKGEKARLPIEQILFDRETKQSMPSDGWVYTGSSFLFDGRFWAEADGVLIGFVHSPAPLIEQVGRGAVNRFGSIVLNTGIGIAPNMPVTLIVRSLVPAPAR